MLALNFLKLLIKWQFPNIRHIETKKLAQWLSDQAKSQPLLVDAREQKEYAVSHLKQAVRIDPNTPDIAALSKISKDTAIVVYCSVGYRSTKIAQQLEKEGFSCVYNLSGGIFQWVNEGRPIFKDEQLTQLVHPYNATWGKLLRSRGNGGVGEQREQRGSS